MAQKCPTTGRFLKGHKLSLGARGNQTNNGQVFDTGEEVLQAGADYFQWLEDHPLNVPQTSVYKGEVTKYTEERPRVATLEGFAQHCGVLVNQIFVWCKNTRRPDIAEATQFVREQIRQQQIEGGAAGTFHATIASRLAGLAEKTEHSVTVEPPAPKYDERHVANIQHPDMTDEQVANIFLAGKEVPRYSQAQIDAGVPFHMPDIDKLPTAQRLLDTDPKPWD
jgi:hypothetical protein